MKAGTSGSVSEPVLGSSAWEGKSPVTIHQWKILCSHMLPLKAASFPHFASRWGCLKGAGRVLKVLINRGTSNMFGKDLNFHTGTLNCCNILKTPSFSSQTADHRLPFRYFFLSGIFTRCVTAVNWRPIYDKGGEKTPHLQKNDKSQSSLASGRVPTLNEKEEAEDGSKSRAIGWHLSPDGDGW